MPALIVLALVPFARCLLVGRAGQFAVPFALSGVTLTLGTTTYVRR